MTAHAPPIGILVELTHRCPLGCPHCSNPVALERPIDHWRLAADRGGS